MHFEEDRMARFQTAAVFFAAALLLCQGASFVAGSAARDDNDKPKDAATFDDKAATLTQTVDGKEKKKEIDLKYALKVKGYFDKNGFKMEEVEVDGPATHLAMEAGGEGNAMLEKGDIIVEIDDKPVKSAEDYAKAMNGVADHSKTKIKVKDINSGENQTFYADAAKR
jgi:S1-C subfamily serine protease